MGIRKASTLQQEVTPPAPPAGNAVQESQEGWIMGEFTLHHRIDILPTVKDGDSLSSGGT